MELLGWMFAAPGLVLLALLFTPFFMLHEWWVYRMPPFVHRSPAEQMTMNRATGRLTPQQRWRQFRKRPHANPPGKP